MSKLDIRKPPWQAIILTFSNNNVPPNDQSSRKNKIWTKKIRKITDWPKVLITPLSILVLSVGNNTEKEEIFADE